MTVGRWRRLEVSSLLIAWGSKLHRPSGEHGQDLGILSTEDRGHAGFENAGLLRGDLPQCVSQIIHVVERDRGDRSHVWRSCRGGIQATSQTGFENRDLDL